MADNFFTDNRDLQFHLDKLDLSEVVEILEDGYRYAEQYPAAPRNYADAKDNYQLLLTVLGDICGTNIAPRAAEAAEQGAQLDSGQVIYPEATQEAMDMYEEILKTIKKNISLEQVKQVVKMARKIGILT